MKKTNPKTVLSARVDEAFKKEFSEQAAQCEMNVSSYTEYCLREFDSVSHDLQISNENNDILRNKVNTLTLENWNINAENEKVLVQNEQLKAAKEAAFTALKYENKRAESLTSQINSLASQNEEQAKRLQELEKTIEIFKKHQRDSNAQIALLNAEKISLTNQVQQIEEEKDSLYNTYEKSCDKRDELHIELKRRLPYVLTNEEIEQAKTNLTELKALHEDSTFGELLTLALGTTLFNEERRIFLLNFQEFKDKIAKDLAAKHKQQ